VSATVAMPRPASSWPKSASARLSWGPYLTAEVAIAGGRRHRSCPAAPDVGSPEISWDWSAGHGVWAVPAGRAGFLRAFGGRRLHSAGIDPVR
jgi:hypothetical protein